jgi:quinol monooxygenase YgiN
MIVIAGTVRIRPETRAEALAAAREMMTATRQEAGCRAYVFSTAADDPDVVCIFEEWESAEALAKHFETPHMTTFRERLPRFVAAAPALRRYEVASAAAI